MRETSMIMKLVGYSLSPLTKPEQSSRLETLLARLAPKVFSSGLMVDEDAPPTRHVCPKTQRGYIVEEIDREIARLESRRTVWRNQLGSSLPDNMQRSHGSVHFVSTDGEENLHVHFDDWSLAPSQSEKRFGNSVSVEIACDEENKEDDGWLRQLCRTFFDGALFDYGFCCSRDEFVSKNIERSDGGERAVGLDASRWLPGFYWGNYFGKCLCRRMSEVDRDMHGFDTLRLSDGVFVVSTQPPWCWQSPTYRTTEKMAISAIGKQFFFNGDRSNGVDLFSVVD